MSLRWRCAPAYGSKVMRFSLLTQALSFSADFLRKSRASERTWANFCRAYGALIWAALKNM